MMKRLVLAITLGVCARAMADTPYPIAADAAKANRAAVAAFAGEAYWKGAPLAAAVVDPMSQERFLPDVMPSNGDFTGPVKVIAAQGEYENGSVVFFAFQDLGSVRVETRDLRGAEGVIPAAEIDVKVVKTWSLQPSMPC